MDDLQMAWPFLIPIIGTICTFAYIIVLTLSKARVRELDVGEPIPRIVPAHEWDVIERGLVPPPEVDPRGFDRAMRSYDRSRQRGPGRHRRAGITLIGVGFGLVMLIGVAGGAMNEGIGVGGFFVIMGLAFFINSLFDHQGDDYQAMPPRPAAGQGPISPEPPRRD